MYVAIVKRSNRQDDEFYAIVLKEDGSKLYINNYETYDETYIGLDGKFHSWVEKYAVPKRTLFRIVKSMPEYTARKVSLSGEANAKSLLTRFSAGREVYFFKITKR